MFDKLFMRRQWLIAGAFGAAFLVLLLVFAVLWYRADADNGDLQQQIVQADDTIGDLRGELEHVKVDLDRAQTEAAESKAKLDSTSTILGTTESQLITTQQGAAETQEQLGVTQGQLTATQSQLTSVQAQVVAARQNLSAAEVDLANVRAEADHCSTGGQGFVDGVNAYGAAYERYVNNQAAYAEVQTAANQMIGAYDVFIANCHIQE